MSDTFTAPAPEPALSVRADEPPARLAGRVGGAAGIAFVLLALTGNSLTGGGVEQGAPAEAYAEEVARRAGDATWQVGIALEMVAFVALLVFAAALARRVRAVEPEHSYAGQIVLTGGLLFVSVKLASGLALFAADRQAGDLDPALARAFTDVNDAGFGLSFLPLAVLLGAVAVAALAHGALPRALGWTGAVIAVLLLAAATGGADAVPVPFLLALVWLLVTGGVMLRRPVVQPR